MQQSQNKKGLKVSIIQGLLEVLPQKEGATNFSILQQTCHILQQSFTHLCFLTFLM
jgi:hypothetical protein